ncbi:MAG TPA: hypothetical protein VFA79_15725 [Myxococcales bacterium]|nr:hypothetical protein [Myxococcales bacterium]
MCCRKASALLALIACAAPGAGKDRAVADTIQTSELYSGTGPTAGEIGPGVSVLLDAADWSALQLEVPQMHPLRRVAPPDWDKSALLFVRVLADSASRAEARSVTREGGLTVRVALRSPQPPVLAVVPAMAWLLLIVPRDAVAGRPAGRVEVVR